MLGATLADTWTVARAISLRVGGDPGYPGLSGPIELPAASVPHRIALLETAGWPEASEAAKQALADTRHRLQAAGIDVVDRTSHDATAAVETAIAGAAPVGLDWTGNPIFTVPTSLLGVPSLSLPVFEDDGLPLGLQLIGFTDRDADLFSAAGAIIALFRDWS